ncbi:MAG: hypothetical protein M0Z42_12735 [Actinomycetota bacterium]|jgi:hypothetical protein|nr:hypothetical protein [Actinomycetota bacterium]
MTRVVVETGTRWVFAPACDWPGWSRRGRGEDAALETLHAYAARYRTIAEGAGLGSCPEELEVVARSDAGAIVDFGAPGDPGPLDTRSWPAEEVALHVTLLQASLHAFDAGAAGAARELRKGPRGQRRPARRRGRLAGVVLRPPRRVPRHGPPVGDRGPGDGFTHPPTHSRLRSS